MLVPKSTVPVQEQTCGTPDPGPARRLPHLLDQGSRHGAARDCPLPPGGDSRGRFRPDNLRGDLGLAHAGDGGSGDWGAAGIAGTGAGDVDATLRVGNEDTGPTEGLHEWDVAWPTTS